MDAFNQPLFLGPGFTVASTGNVFQAGLQYGANTAIKKETGKIPLNIYRMLLKIGVKIKIKVKFTDS